MEPEKVYLNHQNPIRLVLKENSSAIDTSLIEKVSVTLNYSVESTSASAGYIRWNQAGYESGEIRLYLGTSTKLLPGIYDAPIVIYDNVSTAGIVWGNIRLHVLADPEGSTST